MNDLQTSTVEMRPPASPVDDMPAGLSATRTLLAQIELEQAIGWTGVSEPDPIDQLPAWRRADAYDQTFDLWKTARNRRNAA